MTTFIDKCIENFALYNDEYISNNSTTTLIIPSTNDLVPVKQYCGTFEANDHPSNYHALALSTAKQQQDAECKNLADEGNRKLKTAQKVKDAMEKERLLNEGNQLVAKAKQLKVDIERSDKPWNKFANIQNNREKESVAKLMNAFRGADIGGVLILSPKSHNFETFVETQCSNNYQEVPNIIKKYPEICDCIYFHPTLGIYVIEVKAADKLHPTTIDERNLMTKKKAKSNAYEKAVFQLTRMLMPSNECLLKKLYFVITGSHNVPPLSGIVCTPEAKLIEMTNPERRDLRYHHFDAELLSSKEKFCKFWTDEKNHVNAMFDEYNFRTFISVMADCSVGRRLFGVNNSVSIAKRLSIHDTDQSVMTKQPYITEMTEQSYKTEMSSSIWLNATQKNILDDREKYKFIYGAPGTGKTVLVVLAAMNAAQECRGRVLVYTRGWLLDYMNRIFELNKKANESTIQVRDFQCGVGELLENDDIFVDECSVAENEIRGWMHNTKMTTHARLFVAISGQGTALNELYLVKTKLNGWLPKNETPNECGIFQLRHVMRGTKSIVEFWMNQIKQSERIDMECGHSIIGEKVDYCDEYVTSTEIIDQMVRSVKQLTKNMAQKNIAVICRNDFEKKLIERRLNENNIAFGSTIAQDNDDHLIAVTTADNACSREWPFVIVISLFPFYADNMPAVAASRAIAHLQFFVRNHHKIRNISREHCAATGMNAILSSFAEYSAFRTKISLLDDKILLQTDFILEMIGNNFMPPQLQQLFPVFRDCKTLDGFFTKIVNDEQWMLLLLIHELNYFQESRHADDSIRLTIEYKSIDPLADICDDFENRKNALLTTLKIAIELTSLINYFILATTKEEIRNMVDAICDTDRKQVYYLVAHTISKMIDLTSVFSQSSNQPIQMDFLDQLKMSSIELSTKQFTQKLKNELFKNLQLLDDQPLD